MADEYLDARLALEELRLNMQQSLAAADALDQKANLVLVASGLILALATTLQISLFAYHSIFYWVLLSATVVVYILAVGIVLWAASPQPYRMAIASDWNEIDQHILGQPEREAILALLAGYVKQIQNNREINRKKAVVLRVSLATLGLTVVLLVVLAIIP
jgi:hypothetical protein